MCEEVVVTWWNLGSLQQNKGRAGGVVACCRALSWNSICPLTGMKWHWLLAQMSSRRVGMGNKVEVERGGRVCGEFICHKKRQMGRKRDIWWRWGKKREQRKMQKKCKAFAKSVLALKREKKKKKRERERGKFGDKRSESGHQCYGSRWWRQAHPQIFLSRITHQHSFHKCNYYHRKGKMGPGCSQGLVVIYSHHCIFENGLLLLIFLEHCTTL